MPNQSMITLVHSAQQDIILADQSSILLRFATFPDFIR